MKIKLLALILLISAVAHAGTVTGTVQSATTGQTVNNGTFSFTLSQAAIVSGTATIAANTVNCYTSSAGQVVGLPDPLVTPVISANYGSGTLASGTYYVKITYYASGVETLASPEATFTMTGTGTLIVAPPVSQPAGATGFKVYISTTAGAETLQGTQSSFTNYSQTSSLSAGTALPSSNTTACSLRFSDELIPTQTYYTVSLANRNGAVMGGYPQTWCTYGGSAGTINLSNGTPTGNCSVYYPTPILSVPALNGRQSISSDVDMGGYSILNSPDRGSQTANIKAYGAKCDNSTDDSAALLAAYNSTAKVISLPPGGVTCVVAGTLAGLIPIGAGQVLNLNGSTIRNNGAVGTIIFSATNVDNWAILGPGTIQGVNSGTLGGPTAEALIYIAGGHGWRILATNLINSNGWAIKRDPGASTNPRGDHGIIAFNTGKTDYYGMEFTAGTGAEYVDVISNQFSGYNFGAADEAGNINFIGNHFVDGVNGMYIGPGSNQAHGSLVSNFVNHNTGYNIRFDTVTNGMKAVGNNFYANDTTSGRIIITASHGILFEDNFIDSVIQNDSADGSNNYFINNYMVSATGQTTPVGTSGETNLTMFGNITPTGFWGRNSSFNVANGGITAGVIPGGAFTAGDIWASRTATTGALGLGSDATSYLQRATSQLQFVGFTSLTPATAALSSLGTAALPFSAITVNQEINPRANVTVANGANADVNIGNSTFIKLTGPTGVFSISGFTGGVDGRKLIVYNSVAFAWTITNNATSTAANRILTLTGADVTLRAGQSAATFIYDSAQSLWILIGTN